MSTLTDTQSPVTAQTAHYTYYDLTPFSHPFLYFQFITFVSILRFSVFRIWFIFTSLDARLTPRVDMWRSTEPRVRQCSVIIIIWHVAEPWFYRWHWRLSRDSSCCNHSCAYFLIRFSSMSIIWQQYYSVDSVNELQLTGASSSSIVLSSNSSFASTFGSFFTKPSFRRLTAAESTLQVLLSGTSRTSCFKSTCTFETTTCVGAIFRFEILSWFFCYSQASTCSPAWPGWAGLLAMPSLLLLPRPPFVQVSSSLFSFFVVSHA